MSRCSLTCIWVNIEGLSVLRVIVSHSQCFSQLAFVHLAWSPHVLKSSSLCHHYNQVFLSIYKDCMASGLMLMMLMLLLCVSWWENVWGLLQYALFMAKGGKEDISKCLFPHCLWNGRRRLFSSFKSISVLWHLVGYSVQHISPVIDTALMQVKCIFKNFSWVSFDRVSSTFCPAGKKKAPWRLESCTQWILANSSNTSWKCAQSIAILFSTAWLSNLLQQ